jgi:PKD repeat protein
MRRSVGKARGTLFVVPGLCALFAAAPLLADSINYNPAAPNVEQRVHFQYVLTGSVKEPIRWDFGDGTVYFSPAGALTAAHAYTDAGLYTVRAQVQTLATPPPVIRTTVRVDERRSVTFSPSSPTTGQPVAFTANNFLSDSLQWDFDDTAPFNGDLRQDHVFKTAGTHRVVVKDWNGRSAVSIVASLVVGSPPPTPSIAFTPAAPRVDEAVEFRAVDFVSTSLVRWDFGDGGIENDATPPAIAHVYRAPGSYVVRAYDGGAASPTAQISIRILPGRQIAFDPPDPRAGEEVAFRAVDFTSTSLIRWDFGDGTVENDTTPPAVSHVYNDPGNYVVRAYDGGPGSPSAQAAVQVLAERLITFSPADPRTGEEITFQAFNFRSAVLRWDFGDGDVLSAGTRITHAFRTEGPRTIRAYDRSGSAEVVKSVSLTVLPTQGPRAGFAVSFLHLRFEDGKSYKVVPRQFDALTAFAEIKFEGTGVLQAQWIVDGMPFKTVFTNLSFAGTTIIDSGRGPGLPCLIPGLHEVSLGLLQPQAEFIVPTIRYFVTADAVRRSEVDFRMDGAVTIDGAVLGGDVATIEAPIGGHFLLKGWVRNENGAAVPFALLRVFLDDALVDQKIVQDLKPGEERRFESSVFNPDAARKKLIVALYDISRSPAAIFYIREFSIVPPK